MPANSENSAVATELEKVSFCSNPKEGQCQRMFYCCCCCVASVVSDSVWPHRWQPTSLPHPWDSRGKNTGVDCHFLLQCMKVKSESHSVVSDSLWPLGLYSPWNSPGCNTGVDSLSHLQRIFPTQESNPGLLHCRWLMLLLLSRFSCVRICETP